MALEEETEEVLERRVRRRGECGNGGRVVHDMRRDGGD